MKASTLIGFAGLNGFIATGFAALGSHTLPIEDADVGLFQLAYGFHFIHAFALFACAFLLRWSDQRWGGRAAIFFLVGIACFSGSLYFRAIAGPGSLGDYHWITPLGGMALMGGWLTLAYGGFSLKEHPKK